MVGFDLRSSPHAWGSIDPSGELLPLPGVFPTRVGVCRTAPATRSPTAKSSPHTRGGLSMSSGFSPGLRNSSPHAWGSAWLMVLVSVNPGTLPTCRGGLPGAYLSALKTHLFSPPTWGSRPTRQTLAGGRIGFPTRVGVCPSRRSSPGCNNVAYSWAVGVVAAATLGLGIRHHYQQARWPREGTQRHEPKLISHSPTVAKHPSPRQPSYPHVWHAPVPAMPRSATSRHTPTRIFRTPKHATPELATQRRTSENTPLDATGHRRRPATEPSIQYSWDRKLQVRRILLWASHFNALEILNRCHQPFSFDVNGSAL